MISNKMIERVPDLYSYTVKTDSGFSPNPFGGVCSLACSKPIIRNRARIGDWIIGTTFAPKRDKLVYAMRVTRSLTFDMYWNYPEYASKKPGKSNASGDNIYKNGKDGILIQIKNQYHSEKHFKDDTSVNRVLISKTFYYFGIDAPEIPEQYKSLISAGQGHLQIRPSSKNSMTVSVFLIWLRDTFKEGINGTPAQSRRKPKPLTGKICDKNLE